MYSVPKSYYQSTDHIVFFNVTRITHIFILASSIQPMSTSKKCHCNNIVHLSCLMTKPTKWPVHPAKTQISLGIRPVWSVSAKTQISLGIRPVWSESSLCTQWVAKDPSFLHADSKDSDQTGRMPGWSESSLGTKPLCWFCHEVAHLCVHFCFKSDMQLPYTPLRFIIGFIHVCYDDNFTEKSKILGHTKNFLYEPCHEKTCLCHMRTTKAQISLRICAVWSVPLLFAA